MGIKSVVLGNCSVYPILSVSTCKHLAVVDNVILVLELPLQYLHYFCPIVNMAEGSKGVL